MLKMLLNKFYNTKNINAMNWHKFSEIVATTCLTQINLPYEHYKWR